MEINGSLEFAGFVRKYCAMLSELDVVTKSLQVSESTLAMCQEDINTLIQALETDRNNIGTVFWHCKL